MDNEQLKSNLTSGKHWLRLIFMALYFFVLNAIAIPLMGLLIAVQFLFALITGSPNQAVTEFCSSLSQAIHQSLEFLTYNSEQKPFPFADWPEANANVVSQPETASTKPPQAASEPKETPAKREKFDNLEAEETEGLVREEDA